MKKITSKFMLAAAVLLVGNMACAADIAAGKLKAEACAACHGADGNSQAPNFPRLAGQHADYLLVSLKSYKDGKRKNEIMKAQVASLTKEDMANLAAYFASQQGLYVKR